MGFFKKILDRKQLEITILSIFSGMPLGIIFSTLYAWLAEEKIDIAIITGFAASRIFYSLKFIWAPFIDQIKIPVLGKIGHRKSWMIIIAAAIAAILFEMSSSSPSSSLTKLYALTMALGFASASFDIVFDAFRLEKLEPAMQAVGAANAATGYRIGLVVVGTGALYFADLYGWESTFITISMFYVAVIFYIFSVKEVAVVRKTFIASSPQSWKIMMLDPFIDFFKRDAAILMLLAVIFFKFGDAMLGVVAMPFYIELGFTKTEIALVSKSFGVVMTILGTYFGSYIMYKMGNYKGLLIGGIAQSITNASFIWLNHMGHDVSAFMIAIVIENVASGMGNAALIGYLSAICNRQFSATQYALFASAAGLFSKTVVIWGGSLVKLMGWDLYFLMTILLAIPGLILLLILNKKLDVKIHS